LCADTASKSCTGVANQCNCLIDRWILFASLETQKTLDEDEVYFLDAVDLVSQHMLEKLLSKTNQCRLRITCAFILFSVAQSELHNQAH
jgi:hypothetical protein